MVTENRMKCFMKDINRYKVWSVYDALENRSGQPRRASEIKSIRIREHYGGARTASLWHAYATLYKRPDVFLATAGDVPNPPAVPLPPLASHFRFPFRRLNHPQFSNILSQQLSSSLFMTPHHSNSIIANQAIILILKESSRWSLPNSKTNALLY